MVCIIWAFSRRCKLCTRFQSALSYDNTQCFQGLQSKSVGKFRFVHFDTCVKKIRGKQCVGDFDLASRFQDVLGFILITLGQLTHWFTCISYHVNFFSNFYYDKALDISICLKIFKKYTLSIRRKSLKTIPWNS